MAHHNLKIWPQFFHDVEMGRKKAELRVNDRNYQAGDTAIIAAFDPDAQQYDGRSADFVITHVLSIADMDARLKSQLGLNPCMAEVNRLVILSLHPCHQFE